MQSMSGYRVLRSALAVVPLLLAASAQADDETTSLYQPIGPAIPQATPAPSSTHIIGYKPISNNALEAAMSSAAPSQQGGATMQQASLSVPQAGISTQPSAAAETAGLPPGYLTGIVGDGPYSLGRDDVVNVDVRGQPEFSGNFIVGFDGRIQYNYLGDIPVAGMTKYEVQQVLEKLLQKYVRVPVVTVSIVGYNSKVIYVIGEVNNPGKFVMRGDAIKLREAILAAGLPTHQAALSRVHVIAPDLNDPDVRVLNVKRILYKGKLKDDVDLHPGEIVVVPSTVWSTVNHFLGQLLSPATRLATRAALLAL